MKNKKTYIIIIILFLYNIIIYSNISKFWIENNIYGSSLNFNNTSFVPIIFNGYEIDDPNIEYINNTGYIKFQNSGFYKLTFHLNYTFSSSIYPAISIFNITLNSYIIPSIPLLNNINTSGEIIIYINNKNKII
jgi:hypothetical protein